MLLFLVLRVCVRMRMRDNRARVGVTEPNASVFTRDRSCTRLCYTSYSSKAVANPGRLAAMAVHSGISVLALVAAITAPSASDSKTKKQ